MTERLPEEIFTTVLNGKRVYVCNEHHHALIPWLRERILAGVPLFALTLDHHTDTLPAFAHYMTNSGSVDDVFFKSTPPDEQDIVGLLGKLRHDEHFDFAVKAGILSGALLFTHVNFSCDVNPALRIIHETPEETSEGLIQYYANALEDGFLEHNFRLAGYDSLPEPGFLLDIDLDYFKTCQSLSPSEDSIFHELIRRSRAVVISRECDWVRLLNMDFTDKIDAEFAEQEILRHINIVMEK